jgi:lipoprotein-anchoring transpeptidase ErfK/SrfK
MALLLFANGHIGKRPLLMTAKLTRRDFLKLSGAGLMGAFISGLRFNSATAQGMSIGQQGRIITDTLSVYDEPSDKAKLVNVYWKDIVKPITATAIDPDETQHNRVWYKFNDEGYVYSGKVQPVRTVLNKPVSTIRATGNLAEVTVPYTDAHEQPVIDSDVSYRLYYDTVYWITGVEQDAKGRAWYRIYDDKYKFDHFALGEHLRIIPDAELAPISPELDPRLKLLEVRLDEQLLVAYEMGKPVFASRTATGKADYSIFFTTPIGWHVTNHKRPTRHMASSDPASAEGFDLPGIPWVSYFTESGISFHGTYWHNDFGTPRSHGCVNLTPQAAKWVYLWTLPSVPATKDYAIEDTGTSVHVVE